MEKRNLRVGIVAGEASGDLLGAKLIQALRLNYPQLAVEGIGGPAMIVAGCHSLFDIEQLSVMGFIEPLKRLPRLLKLRADLYRHFLNHPPDIFIGIDAPDFNIGLELKLRRAGIPVVHYVSPSVWAWRRYRIHKIAKAVDLMLTILPFETECYHQHQVPVKYVGHPLAEQIPFAIDVAAARRALLLPESPTYIALLPGSRRQEIAHIAEPMLKAAKLIWEKHPNIQFLTSHVNNERYQEFYDIFKRYTPDLPLHFFTQRSQDVLAAADAVIVTSGTATLEAMLYKKPMVITYRMSKLTYRLAQWLVKTPFAGLPNLLANEALVPELIQDAAEPACIADHILAYLTHPEKIAQLKERFLQIHQIMRADSFSTAAQAILPIIQKT